MGPYEIMPGEPWSFRTETPPMVPTKAEPVTATPSQYTIPRSLADTLPPAPILSPVTYDPSVTTPLFEYKGLVGSQVTTYFEQRPEELPIVQTTEPPYPGAEWMEIILPTGERMAGWKKAI